MSVPQYYAQLNDDNVVVDVHVVTAQFIEENPERYTGVWVETFINLPNKTYAGIGFTYDATKKDFTPPPQSEPLVKN